MNPGAAGTDNDRLFCREQAFNTNRLFRLSRAFAPPDNAKGLVALYAFFSAVEQICSDISDRDVAAGKLKWWRAECLGGRLVDSRHPILRELTKAGMGAAAAPGAIEAILEGAESRLEGRAPAATEDLMTLCSDLARPQFRLEASLCGWRGNLPEFHPGTLARSGLLQLLRESQRIKGQGGWWFVPLNLLARHGVSRGELAGGADSEASRELFADLLETASSWEHGRAGPAVVARPADRPFRHLCAITGLYDLKLRRMKNLPPDRYGAELGRVGMAELLTAWRSARRPNVF